MLIFLCCTVINACEKSAKKETDKWDWTVEKENLFGVLMTVLKNEDVPRLWNMNTPEEGFIVYGFNAGKLIIYALTLTFI